MFEAVFRINSRHWNMYCILETEATLFRQKRNFKHKNNEVNNIAILPLWHAWPWPAGRQAKVRGIYRR